MKMAKANKADLDMAVDLAAALDALGHRWFPVMPEAIEDPEQVGENSGQEQFDRDDDELCGRALRHLLDIADRGSLFRVVMGLCVVLDPRNKCVDPAADTIEHHPERAQLREALEAVLGSDVGRQTLLKLAEGQGMDTDEGKTWLAAQKLLQPESAAVEGAAA